MDLKSVFYSVLLLTLCSLLPSNNAENLVVKTDKGFVRGFIQKDYLNGSIYSFTGIPFAKPPLNELRFRDPQPVDPWQGILNVTKKESMCVQKGGGSENCLYLNVYTPKLPNGTNGELLAVMFYIFGGAFLTGFPPTGPAFLLSKNIVLVEVNYRINVFGFLSFEDPKLGVPGNAGLKDQTMGMQWVQRNIKQFGGDPNNVTIFGASAGSSSINLQVISSFSKGLYNRAISESAVSTAPWVLTPRFYKELSFNLGFKSHDPAQILAFMRTATTAEMAIAEIEVFKNYTQLHLGSLNAFGPVIETPNDNAFLTEHPEAILLRGDFNKVDYIMGFCTDEGYTWDQQIPTFLRPNFTKSDDLIPRDLGVQKGSNISTIIGDQIQYFYCKNATPSYENYDIYAKYVGDLLFNYKVYNVSRHMAQYVNVYFYLFAYSTPLDPSPPGLSQHVNEFYYISRDPNKIPTILPGSDEDIAVYRTTTLWTNFAKTGNPNSKVADPLLNITWPPIQEHKFRYLHIQPNLKVVKSIPFRDRMMFWDNLYRKASNVEPDRIPDSSSQQLFITNLHESLSSQKSQTY